MDSQIIEALNWRYATKLFNPEKKLSEKDRETLMEAVRLAPSSFGLQPWKILVISNPEVREKLKAAAWGQPQLTDASEIFVFAYKKDMSAEHIEAYIKNVAETRGQDVKDLEGLKQMISGTVLAKGDDIVKVWNSRQVYIALGILLQTAALLKVDACPMEGFDNEQFDEILGLKEKGYASIAIAAVGYRSENDKYAHAVKARFDKKEVFEMV